MTHVTPLFDRGILLFDAEVSIYLTHNVLCLALVFILFDAMVRINLLDVLVSICLTRIYPFVWRHAILLFDAMVSICLTQWYQFVLRCCIHLYDAMVSFCLTPWYQFVLRCCIHLFDAVHGIHLFDAVVSFCLTLSYPIDGRRSILLVSRRSIF